jgi:IclR family transcriptional regulator, acetate operon repressor
MMRNGTPHIAALARTLDMLDAIIDDGGQTSIAALARIRGIPVATAHRQVVTLVAAGYLAVADNGRHLPGPRLLGLLNRLDVRQVIVNVAATPLHRLASDTGCVVQLGTFENDMVTYRIKMGQGAGALFTKVGMQLEAYCSGIGKALLAHLPENQRRAYLASGPFVALTEHTITDPAKLAEELDRVRIQGFATDDGEVSEGLACVAVPISAPDGQVHAAVSVSRASAAGEGPGFDALLADLRGAVARIEQAAFGRAS